MTEEPFDGTKQGVKFYGDNGWIQVCRGEVLASDPVFSSDTRNKNDDLPYETRIPPRSTLSNLCARASTRRCRSKSDTAHARSATSVTSHTNWGALSNGTPSSRNSWTTQTQPHCCITPTATAIHWKADIRTAAADSEHSSRDTPPGVFRSPTRKKPILCKQEAFNKCLLFVFAFKHNLKIAIPFPESISFRICRPLRFKKLLRTKNSVSRYSSL